MTVSAAGQRISTDLRISTDIAIIGAGFADITGTDGISIASAWRDGIEAYLGLTVAGFPNLFVLLGPNSGLGHNSLIFMIESQVHYVLKCLDLIDERGAIAVSGKAQRDFNARLKGAVWSAGGCVSWYLDSAGVNRALWPGSTVRYWWKTRRPTIGHFETAVASRANGSAVNGQIRDTQDQRV